MKVNPEFGESHLRVEMTLLRKMVVVMFGEHLLKYPDAVKYYKEFMDDWQGELSHDIVKQLDRVDQRKEMSAAEALIYNAMGLGDTAKTANDAQQLILTIRKEYDKHYHQ